MSRKPEPPIKLPPPCAECRPYDGNWAPGTKGLTRCACPRGKALTQLDAERKGVPKKQGEPERQALAAGDDDAA